MADKTTNYNLTKPSADDFYDVGVQNGNMDIVDAELKKLNDEKAPSGHGLGVRAEGIRTDFKTALQLGGGFYHIGNATDSPLGRGDWLSLIQTARMIAEGDETGAQLVFYDFDRNQPKMWFRTLLSGNVSDWFEMLHTGNIGKYANTRIATGTYDGIGNRTKTLTGIPFKADMIFIFEGNDTDPVAKYKMVIINGVSKTIPLWGDGDQRCDVTWDGNVPTWSSGAANATSANANAMNYSANKYYWFAFGKGEGN